MQLRNTRIIVAILILLTVTLVGISILISSNLQQNGGVSACPAGTIKGDISGREVCVCTNDKIIPINSANSESCLTVISGGGNLGNAKCGDECAVSTDCKTPASGGSATCRNGRCENNACPAGNTIPGANCACNFANSCGQPCGISVGLCTAGLNCGFVGSANSCLKNEGNVQQQFCLPNSPANGYTLRVCNGIAANHLLTPSGGLTSTQAQVIEACTPIAVTTTCYSCSSSLTDGNECVPTTVSGTTCPTGSSAQVTECASQVGGSCPVQGSTSITCYRCTSSNTDGNSCESFTSTGTSCPTGSSADSQGCSVAIGGSCPTTPLPDTSIINDRLDRVILGIIVILLGVSLAGGFDRFRKNRA